MISKVMKINLRIIFLVVLVFLSFGFSHNYNTTIAVYNAMVQGKQVPIEGNTAQLKHFFNALKEAKQKKLRVAHWGDSIILGDIVTEDIRLNLQQRFGGSGSGFVTMNVDDFGMRFSTRVTFSEDWEDASVFKRNPNKLRYGIGGAVYRPAEGSWVQYEITKYSRGVKNVSKVFLYYSNGNANCRVKYTINNGKSDYLKLTSGKGVQCTMIPSNIPISSIKFEFSACKNVDFYGVSLENESGVYVDNLPLRGNSGVGISEIQPDILKEFDDHQNLKLVLLNFGVNILSPEHTDYSWYENRMERTINHLKSALPNTSIIIISVSDKAAKKGSRFVSEPNIDKLISVQRRLADKTGIAFWNLYEAMGGENSVVEWVNAKVPLSSKDYTHFTPEGGKVVADLFVKALMDLYAKSK
ncbi:MAG: hypothetical protein HUU54_02040 [Ignavibacteriaceae bacterium]|nr:hypothetical protein [Ignavibacteriaceae bacterium]